MFIAKVRMYLIVMIDTTIMQAISLLLLQLLPGAVEPLKRIHTKNDKTHSHDEIHSHDKTYSFMTRHTTIIIVNIISRCQYN